MKQDGITEKQQRAIVCLLSCKTREQAAQKAGISTSRLYVWLEDPAFSAALEAARRSLVDEALGRLAQGLTTAVDVLLKTLTDPKASGNLKFRTATELIRLVVEDVRYRNLEARLNRFLETHNGKRRRS